MISDWRSTQILRDCIEAVPFARGEDRDGRVDRIARHIESSRSALYRMLKEGGAQKLALNCWLRLIDLVSSYSPQTACLAWSRLSQTIGMRLEQNGPNGGQNA